MISLSRRVPKSRMLSKYCLVRGGQFKKVNVLLGTKNLETLLSLTPLDVLFGILGIIWVLLCVKMLSKLWYRFLINRGVMEIKAIYSTRKFLHIWAAGIMGLATPFLFSGPMIPFVSSLIIALMIYIPHRKGKLLRWFQVEENIDEVYFCIMWGLTILVMWTIFLDPWYGVLPTVFMAIGDSIAGEVRSLLYNVRTKAWIGNLAMMLFCVPIGFVTLGIIGAISGAFASIIEHFEFIDDDVSIPLFSCLATILLSMFFSL